MEWIKCSDINPSTDRWVIVYYENGTQIMPHWYRKGKWFAYDTPLNVTDKVIGWQEYPSPPKH